MLRSMLAEQDRIVLRADGCWAVPNGEGGDGGALLDAFIALDVETTGLRPTQQRIIEIAAIRFAGGVEVERFETLLDPGRALPKYIADLTGLSNDALAAAPPFERIVPSLLDFVGQSLLVGHNVDFDINFVNAELRRCGRPSLLNDRLDTLGLAVRLLPHVRKPSLHAVAQRLAIPTQRKQEHRAGPDAALAAGVALRLAEQALGAGFASLDELRSLGAMRQRRSKDAPRGRAILDRSLLRRVPKAPGVYLMRDKYDRIIYVGKAKNLRDRVGSYFSQPLGYTRKMDGLLESLERVDVEVVGSELEALLLESQLIRRYQPRYNRALRSHEQYPFIRVDVGNPWPRITLAKNRRDDGARYFGPYRNASSARQTVDLLNRIVPLRTCSRSFKNARSYGSPCLELDLGRCLGPCVGKADREIYRA
ncbi:MAG TPA: exonuclease domain-containing protein, partial [Thermomicrobiales bacterium]|nr:exonuclease domain-containing protein [Thermomicrobiales bacterium]